MHEQNLNIDTQTQRIYKVNDKSHAWAGVALSKPQHSADLHVPINDNEASSFQ